MLHYIFIFIYIKSSKLATSIDFNFFYVVQIVNVASALVAGRNGGQHQNGYCSTAFGPDPCLNHDDAPCKDLCFKTFSQRTGVTGRCNEYEDLGLSVCTCYYNC